MAAVKLDRETLARLRYFTDVGKQSKKTLAWLRQERRELARLMVDCGVPADQIARFLGLTQRTHVYSVLKGER